MHRCTFQTAELSDLRRAITHLGQSPRYWGAYGAARWRTGPGGSTRIVAGLRLMSAVAFTIGTICTVGAYFGWLSARGSADPVSLLAPITAGSIAVYMLGHGYRLLRERRELTIRRLEDAMVIDFRDRRLFNTHLQTALPLKAVRGVLASLSCSTRHGTLKCVSLQILVADAEPVMLLFDGRKRPSRVLEAARRWSELTGQRVLVDPGVLDLLERPRKKK